MNEIPRIETWQQERAFRVGMTLARIGALSSIVGACLNPWFNDTYVIWGDLLLLLGSLGSLILTNTKHKQFIWWPLALGYAAAITTTLFKTGGLHSPLIGSFLALFFVSLLAIQTRIKATGVLLICFSFLLAFFILNEVNPHLQNAVQPPTYILVMCSTMLAGLLVCFYSLLKSEQDLVTAFEARYRELFETRASLIREEAANAAKSGFLANISHELRTPLGAILGYVELMRDRIEEKERDDYLEIVQRNGTQLSRLVDDLLDLSKIEAGRLEIENVECSLSTIFEEVLDLFGLAADRKGVRLQVQYLNPIPEKIVGDPVRFKQILVNIVGNALKFTDSGSITISARYQAPEHSKAARLAISVSDTGRGLTQNEKGRLFQPFCQADASVSRKYGGTGLGLSLSKKLARLLGGDLQLSYSAPGKGSVFNVEVQVMCVDDVAMLSEFGQTVCWPNLGPSGGCRNALQGTRILVVDDTADNRGLMRKFLEAAGAWVETASDGNEGIEKALSAKYDIVLMDIQMPGTDGLQATTILREKNYKSPILALTAHAMKQDRQRCLDAGCSDHLPKPVRREELIRRVENWTSRGALGPKAVSNQNSTVDKV